MKGMSPEERSALNGLKIFLTDCEARAYLTLLKRGEAPAVAVAKEASIPREKVYSILERLERANLVRKVEGTKYVSYAAVDLDSAWGKVLEQRKAELESLRRLLSELRGLWRAEGGRPDSEENICEFCGKVVSKRSGFNAIRTSKGLLVFCNTVHKLRWLERILKHTYRRLE